MLDYLIRNGSDEVIRECRDRVIEIQTLTQFQHIDEEDNKDVGLNGAFLCFEVFSLLVRERAKQIIELLHDDRRIREERKKCQANKNKFVGTFCF